MRLIGYVRVSTDDQARDGHSLNQQPERLQAYCTLHGHELVQVFTDEGVSASVPLRKRPGGAAMLHALRGGAADGVVVVRLDRLFRDALDGLEFFHRTLRGTGAAVHSISEMIDASTPAGRMALTIQLAAAQYERDLAVQRASECNAGLRAQGRVYGPVPYGCTARDGRLYRDVMTWTRRECIVQKVREGMSLRMVQAMLADMGWRSPTGKTRWSLNTLWALQDHHDELSRLPLDTQRAATPGSLTEAGVSNARLN